VWLFVYVGNHLMFVCRVAILHKIFRRVKIVFVCVVLTNGAIGSI